MQWERNGSGSRGSAAWRTACASRRLVPVGPLPQRAAVGHGPRGLQRRRRGVGLPPARPRPVPGLPVGRGRPGRVLRRRAAAVPGAGAVERPRPDPQGADVRPDRRARATTARTSRSTGGTSTPCPATPGTAGATTTRSARSRTRTCVAENGRRGKLDPEYELLDTGVFDERPLLDRRGRLRQGRPDRPADDRPGHQRRAGRRDAARAADRLVPQHVVAGTSTRRGAACWRRPATASVAIDAPVPRRAGAAGRPRPGRHRARRCCSARTRPTPAGCTAPDRPAVPEGRHQRPRRARARPRSTRSARGTKCAVWYQLAGRGRARPSSCGCGCDRPARSRPADALGDGFDAGRRAGAGPRPTSSTPS